MTPPSDTDPDLTRKERREQARTERKAMEAAAAQSAQRKRLIQLGGVIGVVVVIIIVIVVASSGGSSGGGSGLAKGSAVNANVTAVDSVIKGIPQSGNVLGNPNAPVTLQYFGDLECPICREFTLGALPKVIQKYVRTGKVKIEYNSLETATDEQETFRTQQVAAYAAGKQNLAWYFIELFYHEQGQEKTGYVTENYLQGLAQQVPGLNLPNWSAARNDPAYAEQVTHDAQVANAEGFTGTPSFLIGKSGQHMEKLENPNLEEPSSFEAAINKLL
ncbi:MAG: thioredoxin domain-containing protein [Solirubrobacteraceae bacterium]